MWEWHYRAYNLSRRNGFTRRGDFQELLKQRVTPTRAYVRFSRRPNNGADWKPLAFIANVLEEIDPRATVDFQDAPKLSTIPIQDVLLDLDGASAIAEAVAHLPSFDITIGNLTRCYI